MTQSIRGVCFDFNGVIVDDERHHGASLIATLAAHGIALDEPTYYRDYLGFDDANALRFAWHGAERTLDDAQLAELVAHKGRGYRALIAADLTLVPGVREFVRALCDDGVRLAVVSAAQRDEIDYVLDAAGLAECFEGIVSASDVSKTKPDPEGYRRGLAILGLEPTQCVVIEDSLPGCAAGRAAGMRVAMLTTSHSRDELAAGHPATIWSDYVGRRPEELPWNRS